MSEITIQFEYPVPDEQYHQTADQNKIGRIRDIQVHPNNGKIYFLGGDSLWLMKRN